jgi:hypothetical protein
MLLCADIKDAFNGLWRELAEVRAWDNHGIQGALWGAIHSATAGIKYKLKVHGHISESFAQLYGAAQGPLCSPGTYNISSELIQIVMEELGSGITIAQRRILGVSFSDDEAKFSLESVMQRTIEHFEIATTAARKQVKVPKCCSIALHDNEAKVQEPLVMGGIGLPRRAGEKILGKRLGPNAQRCAKQVSKTLTQARRATRYARKLGGMHPKASLTTITTLWKLLICSVFEALLTTTVLTRKDYDAILTIQGNLAREWLGLSQRANPKLAIIEMGWTVVTDVLLGSKAKLIARIASLPLHEDVKHVLEERKRQLTSTNPANLIEDGILWESMEFWIRANEVTMWGDKVCTSKARRTTHINDATQRLSNQTTQEWCRALGPERGGYDLIAPPPGTPARHLQYLTGRQRALLTALRLACLALRDSRIGKSSDLKDMWQTNCPLCREQLHQNSHHVLWLCRALEDQRIKMCTALIGSCGTGWLEQASKPTQQRTTEQAPKAVEDRAPEPRPTLIYPHKQQTLSYIQHQTTQHLTTSAARHTTNQHPTQQPATTTINY